MGFRKLRIRNMRFAGKLVCGLAVLTVCSVVSLSGCKGGDDTSLQEKDAASQEGQNSLQESTDGQTNAGAGSSAGTADTGNKALGEFTMQEINGETYTQEMFGDYELTMINVFTTWCTPCVREIPDLAKLHEEMADEGVQVAGIVLDAAGASGNPDEEALEKAKLLKEKAGVTYPFLIPDAGYLNGRLAGISAVPTTFFVDREGKIVGETYTGSRSYEDWKGIIEKELLADCSKTHSHNLHAPLCRIIYPKINRCSPLRLMILGQIPYKLGRTYCGKQFRDSLPGVAQ